MSAVWTTSYSVVDFLNHIAQHWCLNLEFEARIASKYGDQPIGGRAQEESGALPLTFTPQLVALLGRLGSKRASPWVSWMESKAARVVWPAGPRSRSMRRVAPGLSRRQTTIASTTERSPRGLWEGSRSSRS